jgi:DNA topoisomerase I
MPVLIVESASKCNKIEELLGSQYQCIASGGHIRELKDINTNFKCTYKQINAKMIKKMREVIKCADEVILATDDDREGESIAWHICEVFSLNIKTTKRIVFSEITREALQCAIQNPTTVNMNIVEAQKARMILDHTVGYNISPTLWKHINRSGSLSAGRCQTPALRIIYENDKEIRETRHEYVYKTITTVATTPFELNHLFTEDEEVESFLDASKVFKHILSRSDVTNIKKSAPTPFTTSSLQQAASNKYNMSPKITMMIAQKLYQNGKITYMRTDNPNISQEFGARIKKMVDNNYGNAYLGACKHISTKNDGAHAHECIRPTHIDEQQLSSKLFNPQERNLYHLIWKQTIQSCMANAGGQQYKCFITAPEERRYVHTFEKITFPGFMILDASLPVTKYDYFMNVQLGEIPLSKIESNSHIKNMKHHYTEAKLIQLLEKRGIGRPSTFAWLVEKIKDKGYVEKMKDVEGMKIQCIDFSLLNGEIVQKENERVFGHERNKLVLTPMGKLVIEFCIKHYDELFNYDYTRNMEERLDNIADGREDRMKLCSTTKEHLVSLIGCVDTKRENINEYCIEENYYYIVGKYGPCIKKVNKTNRKDKTKDEFIAIKKGITLDDIKKKQLSLSDIMDDNSIGMYNGEKLVLMNGKYGPYTKYGGKSYSLKNVSPVSLKNVINAIENKGQNSAILREINADISIRTGKFGPYVFYKSNNMTKPIFINMKKSNITMKLSNANIEEIVYDNY